MVTRQDNGDDAVFTLDDSCAHCSLPIHVEIRGGKIVAAEPDTVFVQQGGG